ncbi:MAG: tetratricopeptide repeat protein [Armatimonadetes bacterium]|nr:tetratricopeptide repeat protein [Armatimonadota bacterium]
MRIQLHVSSLLLAAILCGPVIAQPDAPAAVGEADAEGAPAVEAQDPAIALFTETETAVVGALAKGEYDRALLVVDGAYARGLPAAKVHLLKARVYAAKQDLAAEEQQLRGALHQDPALVEACLRLAAIQESRGLWLESADLYRQAIASAPGQAGAYLKLARLLQERERLQNAIEVLLDARKAIPDDVNVLFALASAREYVGQYEQARVDYQQVARMDTGKTRLAALMKVGDISVKLEDYGVAVGYYRAAVAEGVILTPESYGRVALATDRAIWKLFDDQWRPFQDYLDNKDPAMEREEVYLRATEALAECNEINAFIDSVHAPKAMAALHAQRRLLYSLICETLVNAVSYLDTGDAVLAQDALDRRQDADLAKKTVDQGAASPEG